MLQAFTTRAVSAGRAYGLRRWAIIDGLAICSGLPVYRLRLLCTRSNGTHGNSALEWSSPTVTSIRNNRISVTILSFKPIGAQNAQLPNTVIRDAFTPLGDGSGRDAKKHCNPFCAPREVNCLLSLHAD